MPRRAKAQSLTIPPPVMGWNTKDPLSQMDQLYAVEMENYFPNNGTVDIRGGSSIWATGIGSSYVYTLGELYTEGSGAKFLAGDDSGNIYDITSTGAATNITAGTAWAGPLWHVQSFKNRLFLSNRDVGVGLKVWTGSGNVADSGFTGFPSKCGALTAYRSRLYVAEENTGNLYYGPVDSISGALTLFSAGAVFANGGSIAFIGRVTRAKDFSEDEMFAIISTRGEILLYSGSYPGSAEWGLVGKYLIPTPCGHKAFFYIGSDLCIITAQGLISLSSIMSQGGLYSFLSDRINSEFISRFSSAGYSEFSIGVSHPVGNLALISSAYTGAGLDAVQFVMNTQTGAWCKFTNWTAVTFARFNDGLYFSTSTGKVMKALDGYFDEDPASAGNAQNRTCVLRPAYNYFGDRQSNKQFTSATVMLKESEGLSLTCDADIDYADTTPTSTLSDTTDTSYKRYHARVGLTGSGKAASIRFEDTVTTKRRSIEAIDVFWNEGDI